MNLLKIELLKFKKHYLFSLAIIFPIPIVAMIAIKLNHSGLMEGLSISEQLILLSAIIFLALILPMQSIYTTCSITKVENDNWGWKQLMLLPIKRSKIYFLKYKVMFITLGLSILSYLASAILGEIYLSKGFVFNIDIFKLGLEIFITNMPVLIFLFIIGRRFTSIIPLISSGILMFITNIFIVQSKFWIYAPWTYSMIMAVGDITKAERLIALGTSLVLSLLMFIIDFLIFTKSDIK